MHLHDALVVLVNGSRYDSLEIYYAATRRAVDSFLAKIVMAQNVMDFLSKFLLGFTLLQWADKILIISQSTIIAPAAAKI